MIAKKIGSSRFPVQEARKQVASSMPPDQSIETPTEIRKGLDGRVYRLTAADPPAEPPMTRKQKDRVNEARNMLYAAGDIPARYDLRKRIVGTVVLG